LQTNKAGTVISRLQVTTGQ